MTWEIALNIILDALKDSALVFIFVLIVHILLSFFENNFANFLIKRKKTAPIFGSLFGLIPQCGTSVLGADLYLKSYITIGALLSIFLSCSDEAVIVLLSSGSQKTLDVIPLILIKFVVALGVGYLVDFIFRKQNIIEVDNVKEDEECHEHHNHKNTNVHKHIIHPLIHALEVFAYVLAINLILGFVIALIGEDNFKNFLVSNQYLTPIYASIIGLIPNCASSVLLSELFINDSLSFGALIAGLLINSGLGMMILLKNRKAIKRLPIIILISFVVAVSVGYICCLIFGFSPQSGVFKF